MKLLIYTQPNGSIAIVRPMPKAMVERVLGPMTDEEFEAHIIERSIPAGMEYEIIEDSEIPQDRTFRNAWEKGNKTITINPDRARNIIRDVRNQRLQILDTLAFVEGRKPSGKLAEIDQEAQRLRDIPQDPRFNSSDISTLKELHDEIHLGDFDASNG